MSDSNSASPAATSAASALLSEEEIQRRFNVATGWVRNTSVVFPLKSSPTEKLFFYGRYKQSTAGDNDRSKPGLFTPVRRYMWMAWEKQRGKSKLKAMTEYVSHVEELCQAFNFEELDAAAVAVAHQFLTEFFGTKHHPFSNRMPFAQIAEQKENGVPHEQSPAPASRSSPSFSPAVLNEREALSLSPSLSDASPSAPSVERVSDLRSEEKSSPSAAIPLAELRDHDLAQRLQELQAANQRKMQQLEQQMQRAGGTGVGGRFATPARSARSASHRAPASVSTATPHLASTSLSFDPSSPFASQWTPSGLTARLPTQPDRARPSPETPFQQFHTPFAQRGRPLEPVPYAQTNGYHAAAANDLSLQSDDSTRSSSAAPLASSSLPFLATPLPPHLNFSLSDAEARFRAQVQQFREEEVAWKQELAALQARNEENARVAAGQQQQAAAAGAGGDDPALQFTLTLHPNSLLHRVISVAKVAVPIGLTAWAAFKVLREVQRRTRA